MKKLILLWGLILYISLLTISLANQAEAIAPSSTKYKTWTNGHLPQPEFLLSSPNKEDFLDNRAYSPATSASLIETAEGSISQNGCNEAKPSEITSSIQDPCPGVVVVYSVIANADFTSYEWEMPKATTGDLSSDWMILSGQGTNSIRVRTGEKNGVIKLTVTHKECGKRVQTLPVQPKNGCSGTCEMPESQLAGPEVVCYVYDGGPESEPFMPYTYFVTDPVEGAVYDFVLPEGFVLVGGGEGEPYIEVLTVFDLSTEDANSSMPGVQQVIYVVSSFPDQGCVSEMTTLYVTLSEENCEPAEPLPVELVSFSGISRNGTVALNWSTASERNNDYFEVQRSNNGQDFSTIGRVKGAGTSSVLLNYKFVDQQPLIGSIYYRLKQIDINQDYEYSKVISVQHSSTFSQGMQVQVFPNPVTDGHLTIKMNQLPSSTREVLLSVMDMSGKQVHTDTLLTSNQEVTMSLRSLGIRRGLYMLSLSVGEASHVQRLLVQ